MITDHQYQTFLDRLSEDQRGKNPLMTLGEAYQGSELCKQCYKGDS